MIRLHKDVPPVLVELAHYEFAHHQCVNTVLFTGDCEDLMEGHMAEFCKSTGTAVIDLDRCVNDLRWMDKGATFVSNAWFNVLYCIYHESQHAHQVDYGNDQMDWAEQDAHDYAVDAMIKWCEVNELPALEQMGYLGERVKVVLNAMWVKHQSVVENEIMACGVAAADANLAARREASYENETQIASLLTGIMSGDIGLVVGGNPYLKADEFLAIGTEVDGDPDDLVRVLVDVMTENINNIRGGSAHA